MHVVPTQILFDQRFQRNDGLLVRLKNLSLRLFLNSRIFRSQPIQRFCHRPRSPCSIFANLDSFDHLACHSVHISRICRNEKLACAFRNAGIQNLPARSEGAASLDGQPIWSEVTVVCKFGSLILSGNDADGRSITNRERVRDMNLKFGTLDQRRFLNEFLRVNGLYDGP